MTNKLEYHRIKIAILQERKVEFHTYQPQQQNAHRVVIRNLHHPMQQELAREKIERMGNKIINNRTPYTGPLATLCLSS
jgi:hypothetical protein